MEAGDEGAAQPGRFERIVSAHPPREAAAYQSEARQSVPQPHFANGIGNIDGEVPWRRPIAAAARVKTPAQRELFNRRTPFGMPRRDDEYRFWRSPSRR
jgi:hypothetical protein